MLDQDYSFSHRNLLCVEHALFVLRGWAAAGYLNVDAAEDAACAIEDALDDLVASGTPLPEGARCDDFGTMLAFTCHGQSIPDQASSSLG